MKIILETSDFSEHYGPPELVEKSVEAALAFAYTLQVMKQPDTAAGPTPPEVTFHDIVRQMPVSIVGPIEVEFIKRPPEPSKPSPSKQRMAPWRKTSAGDAG